LEESRVSGYAGPVAQGQVVEGELESTAGLSDDVQIDELVLQARVEALRQEQDFGLGIVGGLVGGGIGAALWAVITYVTDYQIGFMAVGVGFLVGYGVRLLGRGMDRAFGVAGGIIALVSVVLGNFLVSIGYLANIWEVGYIEALLSFNYAMTFELMSATFSPVDLVFYAIAIYEGYRFSFRQITTEELFEGGIVDRTG
jgi:hypothetical protein